MSVICAAQQDGCYRSFG